MSEAYVTLATNDSYAFGAATLAASLRRTGTTRRIVCMVTTGVSPLMRICLERFFDRLVFVDVFDSNDTANLELLGRPELGVTFTKLSCWRLTDYKKAVFLDADTLVVDNVDDLFAREELSAAPDLGWPDCFNSGVYVYVPSEETYKRLVEFATSNGSFDGGDQGLLNSFFSDWAHKDIARHLPFVYNTAFMAAPYSYLPALKHFFQNLKIVHFLGALKPWLFISNAEGLPQIPPNITLHECSMKLVLSWWEIYNADVKPRLTENVCVKTEGTSLISVVPAYSSTLSTADEDSLHRAAWESGIVEFGGRDAFLNIKSHIESVMAKPGPAPTQPRPTSATAPAPSQPRPTSAAAPAPSQPRPTSAAVPAQSQPKPTSAATTAAPTAAPPRAQAPAAAAAPKVTTTTATAHTTTTTTSKAAAQPAKPAPTKK